MDADTEVDAGLRIPRAPLFGRDDELRRLDRWLDDGERIITLTGSGGIGKTRLATELALRRKGKEPVCFVDLGGSRSGVEALTTVARALGTGVSGMGADDMAAALARALRTRGRTLLVLDALDRTLGELAPILDGWLDAAPAVAFVVTSRERLALSGERVLVVPPLPFADPATSPAVALFLERAERAGASVAFDDAERLALAELVRRLDGLPLAIELAAARADALAPSRLLAELGHRFDVLAAGHVDMRATVAFSWELLSDAGRHALARLGVLTGPFDLASAAAVMGTSELDALAMLERLGRRSLIVVASHAKAGEAATASLAKAGEAATASLAKAGEAAPEGRGTELQLLETIRDFAREQAVALGLEADAVARRDAWFIERAEALLAASRGPGGAAALRSLGRLHVQLQAITAEEAAGGATTLDTALRAAYARAMSMRRAGVSVPGDGGLPTLAERAAAAGCDPARVVRAMHLAARFLFDRARPEDAIAIARRARAAAGVDPRWRAEMTLIDARHAFVTGRFADALGLYQRARDEAGQAGDPETEGLALVNLAMTRMRTGQPGDALAELDRAHELLVAAGALDHVPLQLGIVFFVATGLGDRPRARKALVEALRVARDVGNVRDETGLGVYLALAELDDRRHASARERAMAAFAVAARAHEHLAGQCATLLVQIAIERGELAEAARWYADGRRMLEAYDPELQVVWLDALEAARRAFAGDLAGALERVASLDPQKLGQDNGVSVAADALRAVVLAADALACARRGDRAGADARLATADSLRARAVAVAPRSDDARRALGLVDRALAAARGTREILCVTTDAGAFRLGARWQDLSRKPTLHRLFAALARARADDAGATLGADALGEAGWPGERMLEEARDNRLYVTLSKLRHTGLDAVLEHDRGGWRLRPELGLLWVDRAAWELADGG